MNFKVPKAQQQVKLKGCPKCGKPIQCHLPACRDCRKLKDKAAYGRRKEAKVISVTVRKRELMEWYRALKTNKNCRRCGLGGLHPCQLDFDHLPGYEKKFDISWAVRNGLAKEAIQNEVAKTQLVCKNCHSLITEERRNNGKAKGDII